MIKNLNKHQWVNIVFAISSASFLLGLFAYAYMGSFIRLIGDDYFLAANLKSFGFWGAQRHAYMNHVYFHGNRFGQTFILTFFSLFPPNISGFLPLLVIIVLVVAIFGIISSILSQQSIIKSPLIRFNFSLIIAFFTLFLAPTVNQGLYWRSSMVSSFGTHIGAFILGALLLWKKPLRWYSFPVIFLYALFNAGLSENGASYQGVMLVSLMCFTIFLKLKRNESSSRITWLSITALFSTIMAIVIMWKSPGIMIFKRDISNSLFEAIILSFYHLYNFVKEMVLSRPLEITLIAVLGICLFFLNIHTENDPQPKTLKQPLFWLGQMIVIQSLNMVFIFAIMLPSAYMRNAYPDPRHFIGAELVFTFAMTLTGYYTGALVHTLSSKTNFLSKRIFVMVSITVFLLISLVFPITAVPKITAERLKFKYWSLQWDERHNLIVQAANAGEQTIHVLQMDHIIENVSELGPDPTSPTYNEPASIYYGITIIADKQGWDEGLIEFRKKHTSRD